MVQKISVVAVLAVVAIGLSTSSALAEETADGLETQPHGSQLGDLPEEDAEENDDSQVSDADLEHASQGEDLLPDTSQPDSSEDLDSSDDSKEASRDIADEPRSDREGLPADLSLLSVSREEASFLPQAVTFEADVSGVELLTERADDDSAFVALLVISEPTAPTEYHFDLAIPEDHTAFIHPDGSIDVTDIAGGYVGSIGSPWAFDAEGVDVPTHFTIRGNTLVQVIDHRDATYPVVADPAWIIPVAIAIIKATAHRCAASAGCRAAVTTAINRGPGIIRNAWNNRNKIRGDSNSSGQRPTNPCKVANRPGC